MAGFQVSAPQGTDTHAHQFLDTQAQAGKHLAHLALQPLLQHHAGAAGGETGNILRLGLTFGNAHPFEQLDEHAAVERLVERDPVFLFDAAAGVGETLAHAAVVGEDEQTFAVGIQPPHVVRMAVFGRQQVIYRADGSLGIATAHIATRLVEQNHHFLLRHSAAAVHFHKITRHHPKSWGVHGLAVHFHSPLGDEPVGCAAAFVAARSQKLIQAHAAFGGGGVAIIFRHNRFLYVKLR